tara:strand:+ start:1162 stop:1413 length:252 start_codon:yes stop_codon:yes gene_type:complete
MTQFKTFSEEFTTDELLVNSLSNNPYVKTGNDLLNYIDGMLFWNYVTLQYNYKTGETSHVYSMGNFIEIEDLFVPVNKVAQDG